MNTILQFFRRLFSPVAPPRPSLPPGSIELTLSEAEVARLAYDTHKDELEERLLAIHPDLKGSEARFTVAVFVYPDYANSYTLVIRASLE